MTDGDLVRLTPIEPDDIPILNAWQNDPAVRDPIMGFRGPVPLETTADWVRNLAQQNLRSRVAFAVRRMGGIEGLAQLHTLDWVQRTAQLGILIGNPAHRGQGLGFAAACLLLDYAFTELDLHRVGLSVRAGNAAACRLYARLGFTREGVLRSAFLCRGRREDVALYGLLQPEWQARRHGAA